MNAPNSPAPSAEEFSINIPADIMDKLLDVSNQTAFSVPTMLCLALPTGLLFWRWFHRSKNFDEAKEVTSDIYKLMVQLLETEPTEAREFIADMSKWLSANKDGGYR